MNVELDINATVRDQEGLSTVLGNLAEGVREILGANYVGAYLQGSLATGDFDNHSDVDFLVVTKEPPSDEHRDLLQEFHRSLFTHPCYWAQHLEGSYVPLAALKSLPPPRQKLLYLDHGHTTFEYSDHDHYLAVLWVLREKGVVLDGPAPKSLVAPVSQDALRDEVRTTMLEWGRLILNDAYEMSLNWYQAFAVLSYCRMAESVSTGEVHSKAHGAKWAKTGMDERWHPLIDAAVIDRVRALDFLLSPADPAPIAETRLFIRYVLEQQGLTP